MQTFEDIGTARNAIMDFRADHTADLPEDLRPTFRDLSASPSPVDQIVRIGELIYARRADMPNEAKELAVGLIAFASTNAWYGLLDDNRGGRIVGALRRGLGHAPLPGMSWPEEDTDPSGLPEFTPVVTDGPLPPVPGE